MQEIYFGTKLYGYMGGNINRFKLAYMPLKIKERYVLQNANSKKLQ